MAYSRMIIERIKLLWLPVLFVLICMCNKHAVGECILILCSSLKVEVISLNAGMVTLSPMMVAPVCCVGDPLQLTCTATVEFISWSVFQINEQGTLEMEINDELVNSIDEHQMAHTVVNSSTFTFSRISAQGAAPLISTLSIDSVNIGLNGTVVQCSDVVNTTVSALTTIQIIDISEWFNHFLLLISWCIIMNYRSVYTNSAHYFRSIRG